MGIFLEKQILFIFMIPIWIGIRIILFKLNNRNRTNFSLKREVMLNVFFIYMLCLIGVTIFPLNIILDRGISWIPINLVPVLGTVKEVIKTTNNSNIQNYMIKFWIKNIGGNLILMFPIGVMVPILWGKFDSLIKTTFFAFCLSLGIETLQLISGYLGNIGRAFDIDDILLNTIGASIGFILCNMFIKNKKSWLSKLIQNI